MDESLHMQRQPAHKLTAQVLSEISASLADIDWRLLHWLLRYPLQRADDLVVGVARWAGRATVYRHVRLLEAHGLCESVLPKTPGTGKRLYHLSNPGLHLLAMHLDSPARKLARRWQADEAGLLHAHARLPTLLLLQDVINGLVTHATEAMTTQGRRPELVRWSWQRDMVHHFHYREKPMRFFADGVLALCVRTQQRDEQVLEQWYGLFLLSTGLDDERLMRLRLGRLLYWRESSERWSTYQHVLPVLILAHSQRQRDIWQRAINATAQKLHLDPLIGALASVPPPASTGVNPWLLNWRALATNAPCHLQEVLKVVPRSAFPSSLCLEEGEEVVHDTHSPSNTAVRLAFSGASARLSRIIVGGLAERAAHMTKKHLEEGEVVSLLGLLLTPCQWSILHLLLAHPLLSDEELAAFQGLERKSVRCSLYALHQRGCLEPLTTSAGRRWHLCERGLRLIAASAHIHIRTIAVAPEDEAVRVSSLLRARGETSLFQHIQHTAGIYSFLALLAHAASMNAEHDLCWWETGATCERHYRVGDQWYNLRPDALAEYRIGQRHLRLWLEWDRGTMNVRDLSIKFASYAYFIASREWAREEVRIPQLLCVAPDIGQEKRMQRVTQARLAHSSGLVVWTTTEVLLNEHGPLAPIWLSGTPGCKHAGLPGSGQRHGLHQLMPASKAM